MSLFGAASASSSTNANLKPENDVEISNPPPDSVSSLAFSPAADFLAASSWDNNVRVWQVSAQTGQSEGKAMYSHEGPALDVCWSKLRAKPQMGTQLIHTVAPQDGTKVFSGGADNAGRMLDVQSGQSSQVAAHDAPVKCVRWVDAQGGILATGSWDKTLKYWDLRAPTPIATVQLRERCYTMDVNYPLLVVGTAEKHIQMFNLTNPTTVYREIASPLKMQTRVVSCFPSQDGFAIGSIEGRLGIQYVEEKRATDNFSFKCHRKEDPKSRATDVFSVNDISFNQLHGTFSTAGSDGVITFWDKDSRTRLKSWDPSPGPITATDFNKDSTLFAYSVSYDWSKGHQGMTTGLPNTIRLHSVKEEEIKKKPKK